MKNEIKLAPNNMLDYDFVAPILKNTLKNSQAVKVCNKPLLIDKNERFYLNEVLDDVLLEERRQRIDETTRNYTSEEWNEKIDKAIDDMLLEEKKKKYICLPINLSQTHFAMLILDNKDEKNKKAYFICSEGTTLDSTHGDTWKASLIKQLNEMGYEKCFSSSHKQQQDAKNKNRCGDFMITNTQAIINHLTHPEKNTLDRNEQLTAEIAKIIEPISRIEMLNNYIIQSNDSQNESFIIDNALFKDRAEKENILKQLEDKGIECKITHDNPYQNILSLLASKSGKTTEQIINAKNDKLNNHFHKIEHDLDEAVGNGAMDQTEAAFFKAEEAEALARQSETLNKLHTLSLNELYLIVSELSKSKLDDRYFTSKCGESLSRIKPDQINSLVDKDQEKIADLFVQALSKESWRSQKSHAHIMDLVSTHSQQSEVKQNSLPRMSIK